MKSHTKAALAVAGLVVMGLAGCGGHATVQTTPAQEQQAAKQYQESNKAAADHARAVGAGQAAPR